MAGKPGAAQRSRLCLPLVVMLAAPAAAANLFEDAAVLDLELEGPIATVVAEKDDRTERDFTLRTGTLRTGTGTLRGTLRTGTSEHKIEVRPRGKSRLRVCRFPPLRLDFNDDDTGGTVFEGQDKLKLVTHCRPGTSYVRNIFEEYAAYRILSQISEAAYRVRFAQIRYVDTADTQRADDDRFPGFVIESAEELAARIGGVAVEKPGVSLASLDQEQAALVFVFQYLVGNTDWSLAAADGDDECCHNIDTIEVDDRLFVVPYDFDLSGLVDASYAYPDPSLRIRKVTQRYYRGYCLPGDAVADALDKFVAAEPAIMQAVRDVPWPAARDAAKAVEFVEGFFRRAEDRERLLKQFDKLCL